MSHRRQPDRPIEAFSVTQSGNESYADRPCVGRLGSVMLLSRSPVWIAGRLSYTLGSTSSLNELDGVAVRIGDPGGAQPTFEKVMRRREQRRTPGDQSVHCGIGVVGPENDLDPAPFSLRPKAVMRPGSVYCRDSERESIQLELDMRRFA